MDLALTGIPFAAIAVFALITSSTPGPNNLLLTHSGLAFGFRKTLPAFVGVYVGCSVLFVFWHWAFRHLSRARRCQARTGVFRRRVPRVHGLSNAREPMDRFCRTRAGALFGRGADAARQPQTVVDVCVHAGPIRSSR